MLFMKLVCVIYPKKWGGGGDFYANNVRFLIDGDAVVMIQ